jgi:hypothetical protein
MDVFNVLKMNWKDDEHALGGLQANQLHGRTLRSVEIPFKQAQLPEHY